MPILKDKFKPYSVERGGYVTIKELVYDLVRDLTEYYVHPDESAVDFSGEKVKTENAFEILYPTEQVSLDNWKVEPNDTFVLQATKHCDPLSDVGSNGKVIQPWVIRFDCSPQPLDDAGEATQSGTLYDDDMGVLHVNITTPLQIDGTDMHYRPFAFVPPNTDPASPIFRGTLGFLGKNHAVEANAITGEPFLNENSTLAERFIESGFLNRREYVQLEQGISKHAQVYKGHAANVPMGYTLTVARHGISLCLWEQGTDQYDWEGHRHSWFNVQRLVDKDTGAALVDQTKSHCPLVCIYGVNHKTISGVKYFIVRESDVHRPTEQLDATYNGVDSHFLINPYEQICTTDDYTYTVSIPSSIATPRYLFLEEADLMAFTSADVVSQDGLAELSMYNMGVCSTAETTGTCSSNNAAHTSYKLCEDAGYTWTSAHLTQGDCEAAGGTWSKAKRRYKGLLSNRPYNSGMRIMMRWFSPENNSQSGRL